MVGEPFCFPFGFIALGTALIGFLLTGFGVPGIIAGSFAAMWQSSIGNVVAGSTFAHF